MGDSGEEPLQEVRELHVLLRAETCLQHEGSCPLLFCVHHIPFFPHIYILFFFPAFHPWIIEQSNVRCYLMAMASHLHSQTTSSGDTVLSASFVHYVDIHLQ